MSRQYGTHRRSRPDDGLDVWRGLMFGLGAYALLGLAVGLVMWL